LKINRAAAVLFVARVEATRDFFKRLGFAVSVEIPDGGSVGFAMLERDGVQVMVETLDNGHEPPALRNVTKASRHAAVFVEVDDLDAVIAALDGEKILVERHKTFYNSDELTYQEPGGHLVTFARFA
jgi:catechol 2,3-dioxygenase-like lactoylglutathione lyase family enzyme